MAARRAWFDLPVALWRPTSTRGRVGPCIMRRSHKLILRSPFSHPFTCFGHHVRQPCDPFDLCHYRLTGSDDRSSRPQIPTPLSP